MGWGVVGLGGGDGDFADACGGAGDGEGLLCFFGVAVAGEGDDAALDGGVPVVESFVGEVGGEIVEEFFVGTEEGFDDVAAADDADDALVAEYGYGADVAGGDVGGDVGDVFVFVGGEDVGGHEGVDGFGLGDVGDFGEFFVGVLAHVFGVVGHDCA